MLPALEVAVVVWHSRIVTGLLPPIEVFEIWPLSGAVDTVPYVSQLVPVADEGALPILALVTRLGSRLLVFKVIRVWLCAPCRSWPTSAHIEPSSVLSCAFFLYGSRGFQIESCWKRTSVIDWTAAWLPLFSQLLGCLDRNRTSVPPSEDSIQQLGRPVYTSRIPFLPAAPQFFPSSRRLIWDLEPRGLLCSWTS